MGWSRRFCKGGRGEARNGSRGAGRSLPTGRPGMRSHEGVHHLREAASGAAISDALYVDAGALEEKEKLVGKSLGLEKTGVTAEAYESLALARLVMLDHQARGMILLRKL